MRGDRKIDDYVLLDATHLGREVVEAKIPDIADFCRTYLDIDPAEKPMPVQPTAHYAMGGIPTDVHGQVTTGAVTYEGLYAAGECACVSVHGANRLGTNSLVDLIVFGRRAGRHIADYVRGADMPVVPNDSTDTSEEIIRRLKENRGKAKQPGHFYEEMQNTMMSNVGVYRTADRMKQAVKDVGRLREEFEEVGVADETKSFNAEVLHVLELGNLLDLSLVTAESALNRTESRGAHSREDFPERDDTNWLKHTLASLKDGKVSIDYKSVDVSIWKPKPRTY
jgi:succinate dehydrogenase / fumarate reductase flavoprotein subunit